VVKNANYDIRNFVEMIIGGYTKQAELDAVLGYDVRVIY
jgi:hypothetical protein